MADENRYFQWLVGENQGEVKIFEMIVEEDGMIYVTFKDGSRINQNLIAPLNNFDATGKMMAEIDHPTNCWRFKEEWVGREEERWEANADGERVCVQPFVPGKKIVKLIPPNRTNPKTISSKFGEVAVSLTGPKIVEVPIIPTNLGAIGGPSLSQSDPVFIMMEKSKKVDTEIEMSLTISLPPKSLYNVAKESFDDGADKALEYIIHNIDLTKIKESLKAGIRQMYEAKFSQEEAIGYVIDNQLNVKQDTHLMFEPRDVTGE